MEINSSCENGILLRADEQKRMLNLVGGANTSGVFVCPYVLGMKGSLLGAGNVLRSKYVELVQCIELGTYVLQYSRTPLIRTLVIRMSDYPDRLGPSGRFVENSTKLPSLEITGYRIKYSTVLWLTELQIKRGREV